MTPPSAADIERLTPHGIAVLVEGETDQEDASFFRYWFGRASPTFSFFACNGWLKVTATVAQLRRASLLVPVYAVVDRDFREDAELEQLNAAAGETHVLRLPKFTIENYLLDAAVWRQVLRVSFIRHGSPPQGWATDEEVGAQIGQSYRNALPASAFNWTVKALTDKFGSRVICPKYVRHPSDERLQEPVAVLSGWSKTAAVTEDVVSYFNAALSRLRGMKFVEWERFVSGKMVLEDFHRRLPVPPGYLKRSRDDYLCLYLREQMDAPADLAALLGRIRALAGR